jgi:chitinase
MAKTKKTRLNFVEKAVHFLKKHRFDGLDLDWEYPANRETEDRPEDKFFFTELCKVSCKILMIICFRSR